MRLQDIEPGDTVFCAQAIFNDGTFPECEENALLVASGQRGVITNVGYVEAQPDKLVFLVRFEMPGSNQLGPEIGCWEEDLAAETA